MFDTSCYYSLSCAKIGPVVDTWGREGAPPLFWRTMIFCSKTKENVTSYYQTIGLPLPQCLTKCSSLDRPVQ